MSRSNASSDTSASASVSSVNTDKIVNSWANKVKGFDDTILHYLYEGHDQFIRGRSHPNESMIRRIGPRQTDNDLVRDPITSDDLLLFPGNTGSYLLHTFTANDNYLMRSMPISSAADAFSVTTETVGSSAYPSRDSKAMIPRNGVDHAAFHRDILDPIF